METLEKLEPIVNGSFNHEITFSEMLKFDFETKKRMAWSLIVSSSYAHSFKNIASAVFTPLVQKYTYEMLTIQNIDQILTEVRTEFNQHHKNLLALTSNLYYTQGQQIYEAQKNLGFGGFLKMDYRKIVGYIQAGGSWNDFKASDVASGVRELESLAPLFYKRNNPNNGMKRHDWAMRSDYLTMSVDYITQTDLGDWLAFYTNHWGRIGRNIKADSIRMEQNDLGNGAFSLEFIFWWD
jgi:hypothetical protein